MWSKGYENVEYYLVEHGTNKIKNSMMVLLYFFTVMFTS